MEDLKNKEWQKENWKDSVRLIETFSSENSIKAVDNIDGYRCPSCFSLLSESNTGLSCLKCGQNFCIKDKIISFSNSRALNPDSILSSEEIEQLYREIKFRGWSKGLTRFYSFLKAEKFSLFSNMIERNQAGWKFLLNLNDLKRVLIFDTTLGSITESFAPHSGVVYTINPDLRVLKCIEERLKENGINNVKLIKCTETRYLPFQDGFFDLVIVHDIESILHLIGRDSLKLKKGLNWYVKELKRVLHPSGSLYFSFHSRFSFHRIMAKFADKHDGYFTRNGKAYLSFHLINRVLKRAGFSNIRYYSGYPSLLNLNELFDINSFEYTKKTQNIRRRIKDYFVRKGIFAPAYIFVVSRRQRISNLDSFIENTVNYKKLNKIQRYIISSLHVIVLASYGGRENNNGVVVKLPLNKRADNDCSHNFTILNKLRELNHPISYIVPKPLRGGIYNGHTFFVESKLNGIAIDEPGKFFDRAFSKTIDFVIDLHRKTLRRQKIDDIVFEKLFSSYLNTFKSYVSKKGINDFVNFKGFLKRKFNRQDIPIVIQHGDLKLENILIDHRTASIKGIIDWELSQMDGLPLLDLFHLLASRRRVLEKKSLEEVITDNVIPLNFNRWEEEILHRYMEYLGMDKGLLAPFAILYWIHHIGKRIRAGFIKTHPVFIEMSILSPYRLLNSLYFTPHLTE